MVFRRFHRTAGPPLLLAFVGIIAAIVVPQFKRPPAHSLSFVGYEDATNPTNAMFLFPRAPDSRFQFLNLMSIDRQHTRLIYKDRSGHLFTNEAINAQFDLTSPGFGGGKRRMIVAIPPDAAEFSVTHFYRLRHGKASNTAGPGPPQTHFVIPWGKTVVFESGTIKIAETALSSQ
jgi:hypothetical protein